MEKLILKNLSFSTTRRVYRNNSISFYKGININNYNSFRQGGLRFKNF